jgi:hypothetical protein
MPIIIRISAKLGLAITDSRRWRASGSSSSVARVARGQRQLAALHLHATPVDLVQQVGHVDGHDVDNLLAQGFGSRQRHRLAHRTLGPLGVAAMLLRQPADEGRGVVDLLGFHRITG